ncbi:mechanosensitive ion channel family protein [Sphingosinicella sp. YJ22]|uniref:mechanosensitive ion channel family protein n=1 Tax=Sphingosinicella sp. YJ22 TaxID=1104780 RepID=UPI00140C0492|nr:mechanosensitive ion channel family protein [Sphingosinicella sp. YJ22]
MTWLEDLTALLGSDARPFAALAVALVAGAFGHLVLFQIGCAWARRARWESWRETVGRLRWPSFWLLCLFVTSAMVRSFAFPRQVEQLWPVAAGFLFPAVIGWTALAALRVFAHWVERRSDISSEDNLAARRRRTRLDILARVGAFAILFVTLAMMLLSVPSIRSVGITLMASAGLAGLAVGAAAQPLLKNIIAGVQMAFSEPVRIDDVVIIDGEWGRIEEIRLTYLVVALWDQRRLVVPISRFLEKPFENWTRFSSQILGTLFLRLDPVADVDRVRRKVDELLPENPRWDRRVGVVQVTDIRADSIEVRVLVSAANASAAFDLRCDLREALLAFLRDEMPEALPRNRELISGTVETKPALARAA